MSGLVGESSLISVFSEIGGAVWLGTTLIIILLLVFITKITNLKLVEILHKILEKILALVGKWILRKERSYNRDIEIGRITDKRAKYKMYRFLSDLIIDLGMSSSGIVPYELLFITVFLSSVATLALCKILFDNVFLTIVVAPIFIVGTFCVMYTKANLAHESRIEAVIEAENIISNNIRSGVIVAVRDNLDVMPKQVRQDFKDFLDNIQYKSYHKTEALLILNSKLGSIADEFIKKCIVFETEERHGTVGTFRDVVELNNIKTELRIEMKRDFEKVVSDFKISTTMIFAFLGVVIAIYPDVRAFYFNTAIGQIILIIDLLLLISEYVYITFLRAKEI